jgi:DNA-binding response OmpR family regulator
MGINQLHIIAVKGATSEAFYGPLAGRSRPVRETTGRWPGTSERHLPYVFEQQYLPRRAIEAEMKIVEDGVLLLERKIKKSCRFVSWVGRIMETILVVEDDPKVQRILRRLFESEGYRIEVCGDGRSAMDAFRKEAPTAVILDLRLPMLSGTDILREIRRETTSLPVVVVSARTDETDKVVALELGADDYVTKPFSPKELLTRVRAAIRRAQRGSADASDLIHFGMASVDFTRMQASVSGDSVYLTSHEFRMLKLLVQNVDRVVHRSEILTEVFGNDGSCQSRTMDNIVLRLRQKLERDPTNPVHILTVRGIGYRFSA